MGSQFKNIIDKEISPENLPGKKMCERERKRESVCVCVCVCDIYI